MIDFLRRHLDEPITVSYAARRLGIGRRRLERRFADCFGWGPGEQLMRLRIERARQLLVDTDSPISQIAEESGFSCSAQFSTTFKRRTGMTPSEYRIAHLP
ncbi:MAG: helix-turn-helix domain-containing protein [bacterium]